MKRALLLLASSLLLCTASCKEKSRGSTTAAVGTKPAAVPVETVRADPTGPERAATAIWEGKKPLFPTFAELRRVFVIELAERYARLLDAGRRALAERKDEYKVLSTTVLFARYFDVQPDFLRSPAELATVRVRLRGPQQERDDVMALVRVGEQWKALPREAVERLQAAASTPAAR